MLEPPNESLTVTTTRYVPGLRGVPESTPVSAFKATPGGNVLVEDSDTGATPPRNTIRPTYRFPTLARGSRRRDEANLWADDDAQGADRGCAAAG